MSGQMLTCSRRSQMLQEKSVGRGGLFQEMLFEPGPGGFEGASSRSADKTLQEVGWGAERSLVWTKIPMWPRVESADG